MRNRNTFAASLLSLLLCLAAVRSGSAATSTGTSSQVGRAGGNSHLVQSLLGRVHVVSDLDRTDYEGGILYPDTDRLSPEATWHGGMSGYPQKVEWRFGFVSQDYLRYHVDLDFGGPQPVITTRHRLVVVPYWAVAGLLAVPPAVWLVRHGCGRERPGRAPRAGTTCGPRRPPAGRCSTAARSAAPRGNDP
jgi:hypothetical protein